MRKILITLLLISFLSPFVLAQHRVKILQYNVLNYPNFASTKNAKYQLIFNETNPDIIAVEEMLSQAGVNAFLTNILGSSFSSATYFPEPDGDTGNGFFYKDSVFTLLTAEVIPNTPRYITRYVLRHNFSNDILIMYVAHYKAGDTESDRNTREQESARLRAYTDQLSPGTNYILVGDLNLYYSTEASYERLMDQTNPGYFLDPMDQPGYWHDNSSFSNIHTQSTRTAQLPDGGSNGGLDDRFDFLLVSPSIMAEGGVDYIDGTYQAYGNDGQHFNQQLVNPPYPISEQIAFALHDVSDHLPVIAEFNFGVVNDVDDLDPSVSSYNLYQNYPNPFNPTTRIQFELPISQHVELSVFDMLGREVRVLYNGFAPAGKQTVDFNAEDLSSGVYTYRLKTDNFIASKKLLLLK